MALTVSQYPQLYTPAYNEQFFTALSNQIGIADFKYIVTIRINSGTIFSFDILQRPDGYLVYNPLELVKNYIDRSYFNPKIANTLMIDKAIGKSCVVEVKIKEYYSGAIQSTYTYNYTAYDACLSKRDFDLYNYTQYVINGTDLYPLDAVLNVDSRVSTNYGSYFMHFFRGTAKYVYLELLDDAGTSVGTYTFTLDTSYNGIYYADFGYATCGATCGVPQDNYTLNISIMDISFNILYSENIVFKDICTDHNQYALYYLTRTGKISFMNFELLSQETITTKKNSVRLNPNKIRGGVYGSFQYDKENYTVSTQNTKVIELNTNWITEQQSELLYDLFDSPIVYLKNLDANQWYSVDIKDTSFERSKHINKPLFNYTVKCEYSIQDTRQRAI